MAYTKDEAAKLVIEAGLRLVESGLIARTWGNISARLSDEEFLITPSGKAYDALTPSDLVVCKIEDCSYEGEVKPSSEKGIHAAGYRLRPECNFIIHTHQFYATVVGVTGEAIKEHNIPCAAYGIPSTGKLKKNVEKSIALNPTAKAILMTRHGALCLGNDYDDAFKVAEELENTCRLLYIGKCSKYFGKEIEYVSKKGKTLYPAIDDLAQIAGTSIKCCSSKASESEIEKALKGRNAVLIEGKEPVCTGPDAEAVKMLLHKGCACALYSGTLKGLNFFDAKLQRIVYIKKYSKQK